MDFAVALTLIKTILQVIDFSSPIRREIESVLGYKSQLKKLVSTISIIQAVLLEAERQQRQQSELSFPLQTTLGRLNDILYYADDLFDEVATLIQHKKLMSGNILSKEARLFFSRFNQLKYALKKSCEIKNIRETLDDIARDHSQFGSMMTQQGGVGRTIQVGSNPRETGSMMYEEDVIIGRDRDKQVLIDMLVNPVVEESVSCVSIVGIGGLGKTTLAQLVYNDEKIETEFQLRMWVCVSNDFEVKSLLGEILAAATNKPKKSGLSMDQLQRNVKQELEGKKYLLVLDDVWDDVTSKWDELRKPLIRNGSKGSRILVTTRLANMAKTVGGQTHELKGLSDAESWDLFQRMTLKSRHEMEELNGEKILKKCAAVPLAIRVIGSSLRGQDENKWIHMGNTDLANESNEDIVPVLKISYYDLPLPLKRCFSYCAIFPKDYDINKDDLISLWMAQGFIMPIGQSLEELGEKYFMTLLERCFFQDVRCADGGEIISCKMHDLIHDVAKNIASTKTMSVTENTSNLKAEVCHVFIEDAVLESVDHIRFCTQMKRMRTLLKSQHRFAGNLEISKSRNLRVLSWPVSQLKKVPNVIGELVHLRYLDLSGNTFCLLPPSITSLFNLQTLKLRHCYLLEKLPNDLVKLVNLRCLDLFGCNSLRHMPPGMRIMTCLHKLTVFILGNNKRNTTNISGQVGISGLEDLKYLKSLTGTLQIKIRGDWTYDAAEVKDGGYISELEQLKGIEIQFSNTEKYNNAEELLEGMQPNHNLQRFNLSAYPDVRFPSWRMKGGLLNSNCCIRNLVEICIYKCFKLKHLPLMSRWPNLRFLRLEKLSSLKYVESTSSGDAPTELEGTRQGESYELAFFPSLQILVLEKLPKLKGWGLHSNSHVFPQLNKLKIKYCDKLTTFPLCPRGKAFHIIAGSAGFLCFYGKSKFAVQINSENLGYIIKSLPGEILQHRPYLEIQDLNDIRRLLLSTSELFQTGRVPSYLLSLKIIRCKEMRRLSELEEIRGYLIALETLELIDLPELELELEEEDNSTASPTECKTAVGEIRDDNDNLTACNWRFLAPTLRHLKLSKLPKMVKLPRGMHCLTSLISLQISYCENLGELPAWISCFTSLQSLKVNFCKKLISLPQEMCHLDSLQNLVFRGTSEELEKRCEKPGGPDWPNIQHIPNIIVTTEWRPFINLEKKYYT